MIRSVSSFSCFTILNVPAHVWPSKRFLWGFPRWFLCVKCILLFLSSYRITERDASSKSLSICYFKGQVKKNKINKTTTTAKKKKQMFPVPARFIFGARLSFYDLLSKKLKRKKKKKIGVTFNNNYSTILSNSDTFHESYIDIFYVNSS